MIHGNSIADMMRYGYILMEYSLMLGVWQGIDGSGQRWEVSESHMERMRWRVAECNNRIYRCITLDEMAGERIIPVAP